MQVLKPSQGSLVNGCLCLGRDRLVTHITTSVQGTRPWASWSQHVLVNRQGLSQGSEGTPFPSILSLASVSSSEKWE